MSIVCWMRRKAHAIRAFSQHSPRDAGNVRPQGKHFLAPLLRYLANTFSVSALLCSYFPETIARESNRLHPPRNADEPILHNETLLTGQEAHLMGRASAIGISPGKREKPALRASRRRITPAQSSR
jgi:hypothetical protein